MPYGDGPRDLEEAFFADKHARLLSDLREQTEREARRDALRKVLRIQDDAFIDRLIAMDIGPERAMVMRLIPLVFVAWADGAVDEREREAIMKAATQQGIAAEQSARELLGDWLERKPDRKLLDMWKRYIHKIWNRFTPDEQLQMRTNLLAATRSVAEAAGGFLGLATISAAERAVLDELEETIS